MRKAKDVKHMIGHPYFVGSEARHQEGTGLELALEEIEARKRKTETLRAARILAGKASRHSEMTVVLTQSNNSNRPAESGAPEDDV